MRIAAVVALIGIACAGSTVNSPIYPDELGLLRRLGAAAAVAYETAEIVALREQNAQLVERLRLATEPHTA